MRNAGLDEAQARIKISRRNINILRHADDTTLMAKSEEELKSPWINMKEESEKVGLKLTIQKTRIMACGPITSWEIMWDSNPKLWDNQREKKENFPKKDSNLMRGLAYSQNKGLSKYQRRASSCIQPPPPPEAERQVCNNKSWKARSNLGPRDWHPLPNCEQAPNC